MATIYMLIGVPGSGKSSWVVKQSFDWSNTAIISTDNIIDQRASAQGKTYSDVFKDEIKSATAEMNQNLRRAVANDMDILWDQTNLTKKSRAGKLAGIPEAYRKVAVFFRTPDPKELARRLATRPGKIIPQNIVMAMCSQLEAPSKDEGFDEVINA